MKSISRSINRAQLLLRFSLAFLPSGRHINSPLNPRNMDVDTPPVAAQFPLPSVQAQGSTPSTSTVNSSSQLPPSTSSLLSDACVSLSSPHFLTLLKESGILTLLDTLPTPTQTTEITSSIKAALEKQKFRGEIVSKIGFEKHEKSLKVKLVALEKGVRLNWKHGYEDQVGGSSYGSV